jgi:prepilin-type N-terminal cleavage/methylation domain-containing protein
MILARQLRISRPMSAIFNLGSRRTRPVEGFTLIEMMLVVAVGMILAAMAVPMSGNFINSTRADSSIIATIDAMTTARDRSVAERRNFEISFVNPNHIVITRDEVPGPTQTVISDTVLENGQQFVLFGALPDTPDAFGKTAAIKFTGTGPWMFTSDGSFVDSNGDVANGTVFLGVPGEQNSARAVTVYGVTGLMRTWKWRGSKWFE